MSHHTINVTTGVRAAIESHALSEHPFECCGLLSGNGNLISTAHALRNEAERRESRYFASPEDLFAAMRRIRAAGQQLLGIYHSHPRTVAYPSSADVETAFYPEAIYFIISLVPQIELRAFEIKEAQIREVLISTID